MAPRLVEISPGDVVWENMSIRWWERYLRTGVVIVIVALLIIGWAVPIAFTGMLSQLRYLQNLPGLGWISSIPDALISPIQGILPPLMLAILLLLLPLVLRMLAKGQGIPTGMGIELTVQHYYFFFLFVQIFLVVTLAAGLPSAYADLTSGIQNLPMVLAQNLPRSSNYFFSYLLLQALSTSAGVLVQVMGLIGWFILGPIFDTTARQKWSRQVNLPDITWGTFFPVFTNFAVIGIIYSVIAPMIMIFNVISFGLFWFVYRYNTLYVTKFKYDTGGLLFPNAVNHLFVGLYFLELCLIGLFALVSGVDPNTGVPTGSPCTAHAVIMVIVLIFTALYQWLLNNAFGPLFRYLPITLEDDAVVRDEEFTRAQDRKFKLTEGEQEGDDINDVLEERERRSEDEDDAAEATEMENIRKRKRGRMDPRNLSNNLTNNISNMVPGALSQILPGKGHWAERSRNRRRSKNWLESPEHAVDVNAHADETAKQHDLTHRHLHRRADAEAQPSGNPIADALFSGIHDEIEDLTSEERDALVQKAFQHAALRARRPVIWIPRDELGVSDNEVGRTQRFSEYIWISNEFTGLDGKGKVVYRKSPPDFSEVDLIEL